MSGKLRSVNGKHIANTWRGPEGETRCKHVANTWRTRGVGQEGKHVTNTLQTRGKHVANTCTRGKHVANTCFVPELVVISLLYSFISSSSSSSLTKGPMPVGTRCGSRYI